MNNIKRNIVLVGFKLNEQKMILKDYVKWDKFPKFIFVETLEEALKHQGFMLLIKDLEFKENFYNFDINNRHCFRKYIMVKIITNNKTGYRDSYSKISIEPKNSIYGYDAQYFIYLYKRYLANDIDKMTFKRRNNIDNLYKYLKGKRFITIKEIQKDLKVSDKWVKRYMQDVNNKYQNIGFDKYNNRWYIVKNK